MSISTRPSAKRSSADWERKIRRINDVSAVIPAPAALPHAAAAPRLKMRPAWLQVKLQFGKERERSANTNTTGDVCEAGRDRYKSPKKRDLLPSFVMIESYRVTRMQQPRSYNPHLEVLLLRTYENHDSSAPNPSLSLSPSTTKSNPSPALAAGFA